MAAGSVSAKELDANANANARILPLTPLDSTSAIAFLPLIPPPRQLEIGEGLP